MSDNGTETKQTEQQPPQPLTYNQMVDSMARGLYDVFPKAEFTVLLLTQMNDYRQRQAPFEHLPVKVKLCIIKLAMAIIQPPDVLKEQDKPVKPDEVAPPKKEPKEPAVKK